MIKRLAEIYKTRIYLKELNIAYRVQFDHSLHLLVSGLILHTNNNDFL